MAFSILLTWNFVWWQPFSSGQFQILQEAASGEIYDGFEAQPPCAVNRKAYNLSSKIPSVLQLESLPALNVLTDEFQNYSPSLQDIALYFFPSDNNERSAFASYVDTLSFVIVCDKLLFVV